MFQLQQFNPAAAAAASQALTGAFSNVQILEFNQLRNDGDGFLEVVVGGQVLKKARSHIVVLAGFSGASFQEVRRTFWMGTWKKGQESTPPDCFSETGEAPHADAPHKQATSCRECPRNAKDPQTGYVACSHGKDMLCYLIDVDAAGQAKLVLDTPLIWRASAMSLFAQADQASGSFGIMSLVSMLQKSGVRVVEQLALEVGFHQSSKAPTIKVLGALPVEQAQQVISAGGQPDVKALLEFKPPKPPKAALPTAPAGPALGAPPAAAPAALAFAQPAAPVAPAAPVMAAAPVAPAAPVMAAVSPASLVPPATEATIAAAAPPVLHVAPPPAHPPAAQELAQLQAEMSQALAAGQPLDPAKLTRLQALIAGGAVAAPPVPTPAPAPAPAPAPVAVAAAPSAQAAALAAFSLGTPAR